jgi:hypothetical protein
LLELLYLGSVVPSVRMERVLVLLATLLAAEKEASCLECLATTALEWMASVGGSNG